MSDHTRLPVGLVCVASSLLISVFITPAFAFGPCAAYGPDFALVEGTHSCVRIGGHLRVQFGEPVDDYHFSANHFGAAATSAALRSGGAGYADVVEPRHMRVDTMEESYR